MLAGWLACLPDGLDWLDWLNHFYRINICRRSKHFQSNWQNLGKYIGPGHWACLLSFPFLNKCWQDRSYKSMTWKVINRICAAGSSLIKFFFSCNAWRLLEIVLMLKHREMGHKIGKSFSPNCPAAFAHFQSLRISSRSFTTWCVYLHKKLQNIWVSEKGREKAYLIREIKVTQNVKLLRVQLAVTRQRMNGS